MHVANAGDARVLLVSRDTQSGASGEALRGRRLSVDHNPRDQSETARVVAAGGVVLFGRVQGQLAVSRALGDLELTPFVVPTPHYECVDEVRADDLMLVLSSDGLYDGYDEQSCVRHVQAALAAEPGVGCDALARQLVHEAIKGGSRDNTTVMIVKLN